VTYISRHHNLAFFRNRKTGSTSAAEAFAKNLNHPTDVYSRIGDASVKAQNWPGEVDSKYTWSYAIHLTPSECVDCNLMSYEEVTNLKLYSVIRDPLDRLISAYCFIHRNHNIDEFRDLLKRDAFKDPAFDFQHKFFFFDDQQVTTPILYEQMDPLINTIISSCTQRTIQLKRHKGNRRPQNFTKENIFNKETKAIAVDRYHDDIDLYTQAKKLYE